MEDQSSRRLIRHLPQVLVATFVVAVCPVLLLGVLNAAGVLRSLMLSVSVAMTWSVIAAWAGGHYWRSRPRSGDVVFGDLMLWGWVRRVLSERRVSSALALLEGVDPQTGVTLQQRRDLLLDLASALEAGDPYTSGHSRRVARYAEEIAKGMGLSPRQVAKVRTAAALHDVGKVGTPRAILHKPDRLTDAEFEVIKAHPVEGAEMVAPLGDRELTAIIRHHHERLDGTGYPAGLAREAIPLGARIIAVADTFDAVTSVRPYRGAIAHKRALDILTHEAGTQLDPGAVRAFQRYYTGSRPLAIWVSGTTAAQRIAAFLGGGVGTATASVTRIGLAAALSSSAAATVALAAPALHPRHVPPRRPPAAVTAPSAGRPAAKRISLTTHRQAAPMPLPAHKPKQARPSADQHHRRRRSSVSGHASRRAATSPVATGVSQGAGQRAAPGAGGTSATVSSHPTASSHPTGSSHPTASSHPTGSSHPSGGSQGSDGSGAAGAGDGSSAGQRGGGDQSSAGQQAGGNSNPPPAEQNGATSYNPTQSSAPGAQTTGDHSPAASASHGR